MSEENRIIIPEGARTIDLVHDNGYYQNPTLYNYGAVTNGALTSGGVRNNLSGLGGNTDKSEATFFVPTIISNRIELQTRSWLEFQ